MREGGSMNFQNFIQRGLAAQRAVDDAISRHAARENYRRAPRTQKSRVGAGGAPAVSHPAAKPVSNDTAWSRNNEEMALPPGKTCGQCYAFRFCSGIGIAKPEQTRCDYWPVRFVQAREK